MTQVMELVLKKKFNNATVSTVAEYPTVGVVTATSRYIPMSEFQEIFNFVGELVEKEKITKLVFDKTALTLFHQPSMEWYFTVWKEKMYDLGLKVHRKVLPDDEVFRQSVAAGRKFIESKYPNGKYHVMDIQYAATLKEAIEK